MKTNRELVSEKTDIFDLAGFWPRFFAFLIDFLFFFVVYLLVYLLIGLRFFFYGYSAEDVIYFIDALDSSFITDFLSLIVSMCYYSYMESSRWQATIGKRVMGIHVVDLQGERISFWRAAGRSAARFLSLITLVGYFMMIWTRRRQCLHDKITGTLVTRGRTSL